jgi:hypothetical protein
VFDVAEELLLDAAAAEKLVLPKTAIGNTGNWTQTDRQTF